MARRRWWRRRTRQRQLGYALYAMAAVMLLAAAVVLVSELGADSSPPLAASGELSAPTLPPLSTVSTAASTSTAPAANAGTLILNAPSSAQVPRAGGALGGVSVAGASKPTASIAVLLVGKGGIVRLGSTAGLKLYKRNGGTALPFEGTIDKVNAALATLRFEPGAKGRFQELRIAAIDRSVPGVVRKSNVVIRVT